MSFWIQQLIYMCVSVCVYINAYTHSYFLDYISQFHRMELRSVVALIRHGDRTPKQKMKMEVKNKL